MHASTATTSGNVSTKGDRYQGTYRLSDPNNTWSNEFGTGYVEVTGGSYFDTGAMGALFMADGKLVVDGGSTVKAGTDSQYANSHTSEIGEIQGCTSEIEVKDKSELHFRSAVNFGCAAKTTSSMLIDNSTLQVDGHLSVANTVLNNSPTDIEASIVLQNHATARLNTVKIGHDDNWNDKSTSLKVDSTSAIEALSEDSLLELTGYGAYVENAGTIGIDMLLNGGQLTALDGSTMAAVTANGSSFMVYGDVKMTGALTLNSYTVMEFYDNGIIDLKGNNLTLGEGIIITVHLGENQSADNLTLFANVGDVVEGVDLSIEICDANNNYIKNVQLSDVITVVPEPATATLSLLALCGLAARRRRK
jgi:MYXO-CTERM domain-containing protein